MMILYLNAILAFCIVDDTPPGIEFCRQQLDDCLQEGDGNALLASVVPLGARLGDDELLASVHNSALTSGDGQRACDTIIAALIDAGEIRKAELFSERCQQTRMWWTKAAIELIVTARYSEADAAIASIDSTGEAAFAWFYLAARVTRADPKQSERAMAHGDEAMRQLLTEQPSTSRIAANYAVAAYLARQPERTFRDAYDEVLKRYEIPEAVMESTSLLHALAECTTSTQVSQFLEDMIEGDLAFDLQEFQSDERNVVQMKLSRGSGSRVYLEWAIQLVLRGNQEGDSVKILNELLRPFKLRRDADQRLAEAMLEDTDENRRDAEAAVLQDKDFQERMHLVAVTTLSRKGDFGAAVSLLELCGGLAPEGCTVIADQARKNGDAQTAAVAVQEWKRSVGQIPQFAYRTPRFADMIPALRYLGRRELLQEFAESAPTVTIVLNELQRALELKRAAFARKPYSDTFNSLDSLPNGVYEALRFAEIRAALGNIDVCESVLGAVAREFHGLPQSELEELARDYGSKTIELLGEVGGLEFRRRIENEMLSSSVLRHVAQSYGKRKMVEQFKKMLADLSSPHERVEARIAFVTGWLESNE